MGKKHRTHQLHILPNDKKGMWLNIPPFRQFFSKFKIPSDSQNIAKGMFNAFVSKLLMTLHPTRPGQINRKSYGGVVPYNMQDF